jgi:Ku70/Ku80 beta-barrel domain
MAPRANWKGFLRLSLVTWPVPLDPAISESEKISFNQQTGHRIRYLKLDADTGDEVANEDIVKGYVLDKDTFIEVTKEELENVALESTRTIEIDEFVDRSETGPRFLIHPYYLRPRSANVSNRSLCTRKLEELPAGEYKISNPLALATSQMRRLSTELASNPWTTGGAATTLPGSGIWRLPCICSVRLNALGRTRSNRRDARLSDPSAERTVPAPSPNGSRAFRLITAKTRMI